MRGADGGVVVLVGVDRSAVVAGGDADASLGRCRHRVVVDVAAHHATRGREQAADADHDAPHWLPPVFVVVFVVVVRSPPAAARLMP